MVTSLKATLSVRAAIVALECHDVVPGTGSPVYRVGGLPVLGTVAGISVPVQVAAVISHRSALIGRSNRGRVYLGGQAAAGVDADTGSWTTAHLALLEAVRSTLMTRYGPTGTSTVARLVTVSRQLDGVVRPTPVGVDVTVALLVTRTCTQRRRNH